MKQFPKIKLKSYVLLIIFSLVMVLMAVAVFGTQMQKDTRSRAAYPPGNCTYGQWRYCSNNGQNGCQLCYDGNNWGVCATQDYPAHCSAPVPPTNTPIPVLPTRTPTPTPTGTQSCVIQGYKVVMPNNQNIDPAKTLSICNDGPTHCTSTQPYTFTTTTGGHTVNLVVPPSFGYLVSSSLCYNNTTCHDLTKPTPGAFTSGSSRAIVCPANGYADLWWHIERDPALCPRHKEGDSNCDGSIDGVDYSMWLNSQCYPEIAAGEVCKDYRSDYNDDGKVYDDDYRAWFKCRRTAQCTP